MLGLILALNFDKFRSDEPSTRLIIAEGEYILVMQINRVRIEKAGQQWRIDPNGVQPSVIPSPETLQGIVKAWQQAYISPAGIDFDAETFSTPSTLVVLSLAGVSKATVVALHIVEGQLFVVISKEVYILNSPGIGRLLEPIVQVTQ
jgi:hypothetical protein